MTPEERSILERTLKIAEENNSILRGIRRSNRFSMFLRLGYWVIIIGLSFGAYYFVKPLINSTLGLYDQVQKNVSNVQDITTSIKGFLPK